MANVKSRLKTPNNASKKKKKGRVNKKSSSTGPNKSKSLKNNNKVTSNVVMKRPSDQKVMTSEEKVKYLLKNGHKIKEKFIVKPPGNVGGRPKKTEPPIFYRRKDNKDLPLMTRSGRIKKKTKCNLKLIDSILKNELMINDSGNSKSTPALPITLPIAVNNNNDTAISDQNSSTIENFSHSGSEYKKSGDNLDTPNVHSENKKCSNDGTKTLTKKDIIQKTKYTPNKKKARPTHVALQNGVVLRLDYFECDHCHKTFNRKCSLRRHMFMHLDVKPFICPCCPKDFISRHNLNAHINRIHRGKTDLNNPDLFICHYCDEPFLVKKNLKLHLKKHVNKNENEYKCIYCDKVYSHNILLMQHEKKHMVKGYHVCPLCGISYNCRNRLYLHVKSHLKIKDFICQYCGKEFLRQSSMHRHVEVSHGGHRIVCPICNKNLKGHLTEHIRTHENKRPHVCPECGQRFTQSTQLNVHRRAHTGAKPYPCQICKRLFSHSNALMLHVRRHTGEKPFSCAMCPMSFSQLPHMKTHMRKIHGKENAYKCPKCDSFFKLKAQLDVHVKTCIEGAAVQTSKAKKKSAKKGEEVIEVEAPMSLSRMRFLLALLLTMIATKERLKYLGFNKRLVDDILIEALEAMGQTPCKDETLAPLKRLRTNIAMMLIRTVPKEQMEIFKKENKSTEYILELLTKETETEQGENQE